MYAPTWQHRFVKREFWDFAVCYSGVRTRRKPYVTLAFLQPSSHIVKRIRLLYRSSMSEFLSNIYRFPTPSKCDGRVPSQQGAPSTYRKLGVVYWRNSPLPCGKGGGEGGRLKNSTYQLFWAQNPLRHPELSISQHGFPSKDTIIFELPASKHSPEEQIFWGTDPLGAPSSTLELSIASSQDNVWEILYFGSHSWHLNGRLLHHFVTRYCEQPPRSNV